MLPEGGRKAAWGGMRDRIFGQIIHNGHDKEITLIDCVWLSPDKYHANALLSGGWFSTSDTKFELVAVRLDNLPAWIGEDPLAVEVDSSLGGVERRELEVILERPPAANASFSRGDLCLDFRWSREDVEYEQLVIRHWPQFQLKYAEPTPLSEILNDVGSLESLVTICADSPSGIHSILLYRSDMPEQALSGRIIEGTQKKIELGAAFGTLNRKRSKKPKNPYNMLVSFNDLGGIGVAARFIDEAPRLRSVIGSLVTMRADTIFNENRFLNVSSAAEGFHRSTIGGSYMEKVEWKATKKHLKKFLARKHYKWFDSYMQHSNDPSLNRRLKDLVDRIGPLAETIVGDIPTWGRVVSTCRNNLTHLEGERESYDSEDLHWLAESVFNVTRLCLLLHIGIEPALIPKLVNSWPIKATTDKVQSSMSRLAETQQH